MAQSTESMQPCSAEHWSAPRLLEQREEDAFEVTNAALASNSRGDIFIAGRGPVQFGEALGTVAFPFAAYKISAQGEITRLPTPVHKGVFGMPRMAIVDDTVHLFWGELERTPELQDRTSYPNVSTTSTAKAIWTASYTDAGWSEPRFLSSFIDVNFEYLRYSIRGGNSSTLQVPVVGIPARGYGFRWVGMDGSAAIPDHVAPEGSNFFYPWIVYPGPEEIVVGYIAPDNGYSVAVVRTSDNGQTWSEPVYIAHENSRDVVLAQTPDKRLHAIWSVTRPDNLFAGRRLGYAVSSDGGRSWSEPAYPVETDQMIEQPRLVADRYNNLHLIYLSYPERFSGGHIYYTTRSADTAWKAPVKPFGEIRSDYNIGLITTNDGELVFHFGQYLGIRGEYPWAASSISRLRPGKDCAAD